MTHVSMKTVLLSAAAAALALLALIAAVGYFALQYTSAAAYEMGLGKDVVADILPPPLYVIEAQLTAYDLVRAPAAQREALIDKLVELKKQFDTRNTFWGAEPFDAEVKAALLGEQRRQADQFWTRLQSDFVPAIRAGDAPRAEAALVQIRTHYEAHRAGVDSTVSKANRYAEDTLTALNRVSKYASRTMAALGVIGLLVVMVCAAMLVRSIYRRIGGEPADAVAMTERIAAGNLIAAGSTGSEGILGALTNMRGRLRALVSDVGACATTIATAAPRLLQQANNAQQMANRQAEEATGMATAAEELSASVASAADNARSAHEQAVSTGAVAAQGAQHVHQAVARMRDVAAMVDSTATSVQKLETQSSEIGRIVQVINEIAEQTNLLALNAAIEAARAGETGRGFAVVADEVRKLAERTQRSTSEIRAMIGEVQGAIEQTMRGIAAATGKVGEATGAGDSARASMSEIERTLPDVVAAVEAIAAALAQQKDAASTVAHSVELVAREAESTLVHARASADEARQLVDVSEQLRSATGQFQL
jgi:methyl-accepting chemotaxis protein